VNVSFGEQQSQSKNKSDTFDFDFDRPSKATNNNNYNNINVMASPQASTTTRSNMSGGFDFPASPEVEVSSIYSKKPSEFNFGTVPAKQQQQQQQPVPIQPRMIDSLPPPPPQMIDEDPYEIHTNKPPPSVPYNPFPASTNNTNKPKTPAAEEVTKKPKKEGDPFLDIIVPELSKEKEMKKAKEEENINRAKDPNAAVSLKDLAMKGNMKPAVETPAFIQPTTATTSFQPQHQQPAQAAPQQYQQQQQPQSTGFLSPSGKPPVQNPFAPKQSSVPVVVPSSFAAPEPVPSQRDSFAKSSDPFSHASNIDFGSNDPFGSSSVPLIASKAAPPPVPVAPPVDDFSVFEKPSKPMTTASSSQQPKQTATTMGLVPPQRPVSSTTNTQQHKSVGFGKSTTATGGGQGRKVDLLSDDFDGFGAEPAHTTAGGGFDDDPFASSYNPSEDPFASPSQPSGHGAEEEDQEDMFERFKIMYGQKDKDGGEGGKGDKKKSYDIYDAEFDEDDDLDLNIRSTTTEVPKGMTPGQLMVEGSTKELLDGEILARLSTRSLVTKDWNDIYYVIKKGVLFLYRTK
jgi:hypothetical protein